MLQTLRIDAAIDLAHAVDSRYGFCCLMMNRRAAPGFLILPRGA